MEALSPDTDQIERYLSNEMSVEEKVSFEESMTKDNQLLKDTYLFHQLREQLLLEKRQEYRQELYDMFFDKAESKSQKSRTITPVFYWAAAAVLVLLIPIVLLLNQPSQEDLFMAYYQPYPMGQVSRDAVSEELSEGLQYYHQEQYQVAITALEATTDPTQTTRKENLAIACSYLSLSQPEEALTWLLPLSGSSDEALKEHADWYTALAYLQAGNDAEAQKTLQQITNSQSIWSSKASKLMKEIE